jgi:hypothetical protein
MVTVGSGDAWGSHGAKKPLPARLARNMFSRRKMEAADPGAPKWRWDMDVSRAGTNQSGRFSIILSWQLPLRAHAAKRPRKV